MYPGILVTSQFPIWQPILGWAESHASHQFRANSQISNNQELKLTSIICMQLSLTWAFSNCVYSFVIITFMKYRQYEKCYNSGQIISQPISSKISLVTSQKIFFLPLLLDHHGPPNGPQNGSCKANFGRPLLKKGPIGPLHGPN